MVYRFEWEWDCLAECVRRGVECGQDCPSSGSWGSVHRHRLSSEHRLPPQEKVSNWNPKISPEKNVIVVWKKLTSIGETFRPHSKVQNGHARFQRQSGHEGFAKDLRHHGGFQRCQSRDIFPEKRIGCALRLVMALFCSNKTTRALWCTKIDWSVNELIDWLINELIDELIG